MKQISLLLTLSILYIFIVHGVDIADVCGQEDWVAYKDEKCFKLVKQFESRNRAKEICFQQHRNAELASIITFEEQKYLTEFAFDKSNVKTNIWIGAKRVENSTKFIWDDGSDLSFTNWVGTPSGDTARDCVEMQSAFTRNVTGSNVLGINGLWKDVTCESGNYVLCQKFQTWSFPQWQKEFFNVRRQLSFTKDQLNHTINDLVTTRNELVTTRYELEQLINQKFQGVEGAYMSTFEVGGSVDYYYPVAFAIHRESMHGSKGNPRTPLIYDIYRAFYEKTSLPCLGCPFGKTAMGLTLKLLCTDGGPDGGANALRVLLHNWEAHTGVAELRLFYNQDYRLFVWLRGGGTIYHIRSPIDLSDKITIYLEANSVASPEYIDGVNHTFPAVIVNPVAVGNENINLVKPGQYVGWGF